MTKISYAQNLEDVMLARALSDVQQGTYVDVGANHPNQDSVTKYFYENGWNGINIEPIPPMHELLVAARPRDTNLRVAAGAQAGEATITHAIGYSGLSSLIGVDHDSTRNLEGIDFEEIMVPVRTLNDILSEAHLPAIHFLKIDVEGFEKDVLEGLDLVRFRPWILVIEAMAPMTQDDQSSSWEHLVINHDYEMVYHDGLNRFYLANEHADLRARFAYPPNFFDYFQRADYVDMLASRDEFSARLESLRTRHHKYRASIEGSLSWRITKPLRSIQNLAKRITRR